MDDPSLGNFVLYAVERSDGTVLPVKNFWQTDRTFVGGGLRPVLENKIHLLDYDSTGSYTFVFSNGDFDGPEIVSFAGVSPNPTTQTINVIDITFSETLNLASFTPESLQLTKNAVVLSTPGLTISSLGNHVYRVSGLGAFTGEDAVYELFVDLTQLTDVVGNPGAAIESYRWVRGETLPTILNLSGAPAGLTNTVIDHVDVVFSKALIPASFGLEDISLLRNGEEVLDDAVTIAQLGPTTYRIGNLARLIGSDAEYRLVVDAAGVQDTGGFFGIGDAVARWTLDATAPILVQLFDPPTNPRNIVVQHIDVEFSEPIDVATFDVNDLTLVRNGGDENLLAGDPRVTIEYRGNNRYRIGGINWVQAFAANPQIANFTLLVDASGIRDLAGNSGVGLLSSTWTIDLEKPLPPSELKLFTFSGLVTGGRLNSRFATLTGQTSEPGLTISVVNPNTNQELARQKIPGTTLSLPIEFPSPGNQSLRVRAIDDAGNVGDAWLEDLFIEETAPLLESVAGMPDDFASDAIGDVTIRFINAIRPETFTTAAISLARNSGSNLIDSQVTLTPLADGRSFVLSGLDRLTESEGFYAFQLDLSSVVSMSGLSGFGQIQRTWITDQVAPQSQVEPLADVQMRATFAIRVTGADPDISATLSGSGIVSYDIYVAEDGSDYVFYRTVPVDAASIAFTGQPGSGYRFFSIARDAAGNVEAAPAGADTETVIYQPSTDPAIVGDRVWLDANANGIQDEGELGAAGILVRIYENGSESPFLEVLTNEVGLYRFEELDPTKFYFLEFFAPSGFGFSPQNVGADGSIDSDVNIVSGRTPVFSVSGGENLHWDAGLIELGSLSGIVWKDRNGDGVLGERESVLSGQVVYIDINNNGQLDDDEPTAVTDDLGRYTFVDVRPGQYVIRQVIPDGWEQTFPGIAGAATGAAALTLTGSDAALHSPGVGMFVSLNNDMISYRTDVNGDGEVTPLDALVVLNSLAHSHRNGLSVLSVPWGDSRDVNLDGVVTPLDALIVLYSLSRNSGSSTAPLASSAPPAQPANDLIGLGALRSDSRFSHLDGTGMSVVVIDTGLDLNHPFFGPDLDGDGVADRIVYQYDFADRDSIAQDFSGHGTHVTSIIASQDGRYPGVAPGVGIIHLKVFTDAGNGQFAFLEQALQWVVDNVNQYSIAAVNLSLGDGGNWGQLSSRYGIGDELAALDSLGVITVAAAGNGFATFASRQGLAYPASDKNTISVGAVWDADYGMQAAGIYGVDYTTGADRITSFSQRHGDHLDIFAPGALITAGHLSGGIATMRGTSMAAPFITGSAVLMQQLSMEQRGERLNNQQFRDLLQRASETIYDGDDEDDNVSNTNLFFDRLNILDLAESLIGDQWQPPSDDGGDVPGDDGSGDLGSQGGSSAYVIDLTSGEHRENLDFGVRPIDTTAPQVERIVIGNGASQRSMVRSLEVEFDSEVVVEPGAFVLTNQGNEIPLSWEHTYEGEKSRLRITFGPSAFVHTSGSLVDGRYILTVNHPFITDLSGNPLDGNGDGQPGSSYVDEFFRFFGDSDGDGDVDLADYAFFRRALGKASPDPGYDSVFDFNTDLKVDFTDLAFFRRNLGKTLP